MTNSAIRTALVSLLLAVLMGTMVVCANEVSELVLYKLAMNENNRELYQLYLDQFGGQDVQHSITIMSNYARTFYNSPLGDLSMSQQSISLYGDTVEALLMEGVSLSFQHHRYFPVPLAEYWTQMCSNFSLYWDLGRYYELTGQFEEALDVYTRMRDEYAARGEGMAFNMAAIVDRVKDMTDIEGRIYLMRLRLSE